MSEELARQLERVQAFSRYTDVAAQDFGRVRVSGTVNRRREEEIRLRKLQAEQEMNSILDDMRCYVGVLRQYHCSNWEEKSRIIWGRYAQHKAWDDILEELYGEKPDFLQRQKSYKRKLYRRFNDGLLDIWTYFGRGTKQ